MKQLQKSDLKEGEIYVSNPSYSNSNPYEFLNKHSLSGRGYGLNLKSKNDFKPDWHLSYNNMREATEEEKHWLETCIKADEFVSYEEAMKTFIPEYYEFIGDSDTGFTKGKIYKCLNPNNLESATNFLDNNNKEDGWAGMNHLKFKPSTKEAYNAQFVVKEPEFVLPQLWWIRITKENLKDISKFLNFNIGEYTIGFVAGMIKSYKTGKITKGYNSTPTTSYGSTFGNEITYDQFKKYVLKENTTVTEEPKVVLEKPKDKVIQTTSSGGKIRIDKVECSEGGVYKIGDKITVFDKYSPNKGKMFTIQSFRWTNDKSKICAVTELHTPNGIGLDKIELYVEPKVKIVDDFVLPEKWCVEVNQEIRNRLNYIDIIGYHHSIKVNQHNKWSMNIKEGFTEITFEQFKKYVLKDE